MCGLAGIVAASAGARGTLDVRRIVEAMTSALEHRGPDAGGIWCDVDNAIALGHRRLAIVDLSVRGKQPMQRKGAPLVITFNGEIYNFRSLRASLESGGTVFDSSTDTEVILAAVEAWGIDGALSKMEGAFAFAIWDTRRRLLHLARDRTGQKPLYVGMASEHLLFSSELRSLQASKMTSRQASQEAVAGYLAYGYVPDPFAIIDGVYKLAPGTSFTLNTGAGSTVTARELVAKARRYWSFPKVAEQEPAYNGIERSVARTDELLTEVVAEQLECDVPVGVFLSGGIDSSIVAAKVKQVAKRRVDAYTIRFPHATFDESVHAARIAQHLGMDHHIIELGAKELLTCVLSESPNLDEPTANPSYFPLQLMSRNARREVTVALSGDGGDEIFAGYNRYRALEMLFKIRSIGALKSASGRGIGALLRHPRMLQPLERLLVSTIPQGNLQASLGRLERFFSAATHGEAYRSSMQTVSPTALLTLLGKAPEFDAPDFGIEGRNWLREMMRDDIAMYLPGDNLAKVDRASMRESLEVRLPLLDRRVVEFSATLPNEHLILRGTTKRTLRILLTKYLPDALIERPKMGFSVPIEEWLRTDLKSWADAALSSDVLEDWIGLRPEAVSGLWTEFLRSEGRRNGRIVWGLAMLSEWANCAGAGGLQGRHP